MPRFERLECSRVCGRSLELRSQVVAHHFGDDRLVDGHGDDGVGATGGAQG